MNSELKPCPFCGGEAELRFFNNGSSFSYRVECLNCTAMVGRRFEEYSTNRTFWFGIKQEAIDAWNTRAERTCKPETEVLETVDIGIGLLERLIDNCSDCGEPLTCDYSSNTPWRRVLPNYCPNCGAKVVK